MSFDRQPQFPEIEDTLRNPGLHNGPPGEGGKCRRIKALSDPAQGIQPDVADCTTLCNQAVNHGKPAKDRGKGIFARSRKDRTERKA